MKQSLVTVALLLVFLIVSVVYANDRPRIFNQVSGEREIRRGIRDVMIAKRVERRIEETKKGVKPTGTTSNNNKASSSSINQSLRDSFIQKVVQQQLQESAPTAPASPSAIAPRRPSKKNNTLSNTLTYNDMSLLREKRRKLRAKRRLERENRRMKQAQENPFQGVQSPSPKQLRREKIRLAREKKRIAREEERGLRVGVEPVSDEELERVAKRARRKKQQSRKKLDSRVRMGGVHTRTTQSGNIEIVIHLPKGKKPRTLRNL
ncbi:hypothetical protein C9374_003125 [Naegleria lovaniensis]|uniref:Uncharacterized protein n=1 Tax=Naegleria lovaniensis TaxID=51637 RepID=A0AA88KM25_NAELO|nr:uncharacterized protein C9374_003125 [Naegleria lovaniensis]KAG2385976.1 hypothetical protein C9374_003125 [Naegleria lovaniensis]